MSFRENPDPRAFRDVLGTFTTGVTIITTRGCEGEPIGVTANSFNSVSLEPPMVLWSLAKSARSLPAFNEAAVWAVHILSMNQEVLASRFARSGGDKFSGLDLASGVENLPLLRGCTARIQCRTAIKCEAGDHIVFIGEVLDFDRCNLPPLVYQAGSYAWAMRRTEKVFVQGWEASSL